MNVRFSFVFALLSIAFHGSYCQTSVSITTNLQPHISSLKDVFTECWDFSSLSCLFYAIKTYKTLSEKLPIEEKSICLHLKTVDLKTNQDAYFVAGIWNAIPSCPDNGNPVIQYVDKMKVNLQGTSLEELFYASELLKNTNKQSLVSAKMSFETVRTTLSSNTSTMNLGWALQIAASFGKEDADYMYKWIANIVASADEVDGQYYQYEGGIVNTATILRGIFEVCELLNKSPPMSKTELVKFANYLLGRHTTNRPKPVYHLIDALTILSRNKFWSMMSVNGEDHTLSLGDVTTMKVRVTDLLGKALDPINLVARSIISKKTKSIVVNKEVQLTPTSDNTVFELSLKDLPITAGIFDVQIFASYVSSAKAGVGKADAAKVKEPVLVNPENTFIQRFSTKAVVKNCQLGILSTGPSTANYKKITYPSKLAEELRADVSNKISIKFDVSDALGKSSKAMKPHQAFVRFVNLNTNQHTIFTCPSDANYLYQLTLDVMVEADRFHRSAGVYAIELLAGDPSISEPFVWKVADIAIKFTGYEDQVVKTSDSFGRYYEPKTDIKHTFREPEVRPPVFVTDVFTALVCFPVLVLFVSWINLRAFPKFANITISSLAFHSSLIGIFSLLYMFWWSWNIFETTKYASGVGALTFLFGHNMLSGMAAKRSSNEMGNRN